MKPTQQLHELGQSLWLDNITRDMLGDGTLRRYIDELSITGLTSNPTIFDKAISGSDTYDDAHRRAPGPKGLEPEQTFFELAIADLRDAARMFEPINERTDGVDGWVSLEVSPLLADDAKATIAQVAELHRRADGNVFIKIPGTAAGREAIEESIFAGTPVNVTLLFSTEHYLGAAEAYMRGVERRIEAGLDPRRPLGGLDLRQPLGRGGRRRGALEAPQPARNRRRHATPIARIASCSTPSAGSAWPTRAPGPRRLLFASTGTKDPDASDTLYIEALAAPLTINTMPDKTLLAFADHGEVADPLPADGGDAESVLDEFDAAGVDVAELGARLQREGAEAFDKSWKELLAVDRREEPQARRNRMTLGEIRSRARRPNHERSPCNATRNDRIGSDGSEHGASPASRRPRVRRLRPRFRRCEQARRRGRRGRRLDRGPGEQADSPRGRCG